MKHKISKFQRKKLITKAHKLLDRIDSWIDNMTNLRTKKEIE